MTKEEILGMERLENDSQLDEAVDLLDTYIMDRFDLLTDAEHLELDKLSDLIFEYEERTDILNR